MIWTLQSMFGQFFDATVGQMLSALGGPRPGNQSSPWNATPPQTRLALPPAPGAASPSPPVAAWQPAGGGTAGTVVEVRQEGQALSPRDLDDDAIQLVKYALVSIRPCHEKVLIGGVILVTTRMTAASFSSWIVAQYLQSPEYRAAVAGDRRNEIAHADKKYLRVSYGVLRRYPREPKSGCGQSKLNALKGIRNALLGLRLPPAARPAAPPPAPARRREAAAAAEVAPVPTEATLSTAGEIPAQAPATALPAAEPIAPSRPRPARPRRPRRQPQVSTPAPEEPPRRPRRQPPVSAPAPEEPPRPETRRPARRRPGPPRRRPR
jgi:hypothetical protein